jgi:hypothetical protein
VGLGSISYVGIYVIDDINQLEFRGLKSSESGSQETHFLRNKQYNILCLSLRFRSTINTSNGNNLEKSSVGIA